MKGFFLLLLSRTTRLQLDLGFVQAHDLGLINICGSTTCSQPGQRGFMKVSGSLTFHVEEGIFSPAHGEDD